MALARLPGRPAQGHPVVERAVVPDVGRLADHDAHPVIDEHPAANDRSRMDLDPRQPAGPVGQPAGEPPQPGAPEPMRYPTVPSECMQTWIAGQHLPLGSGGGVAVENDGDVFAKATEHTSIFPFPTGLLNYWGLDDTH